MTQVNFIKEFTNFFRWKNKKAIALIDESKLLEKGIEATTSLQALRNQKNILDDAIALLEQQLEQTVSTLLFGAELLEQQFKYLESAKYCEAIITILESDPEGRKKQIAKYQIDAGFLFKEAGNYNEAIKHYSNASKIYSQIFETAHPFVATNYSHLSLLWLDLGNLEKALHLQEKALEIDEKLYEQTHPSIAIRCNNLALIYQDLGKFETALDLQKKAFKIDIEIFEETNPQIAAHYNNIALTYKELGNFELALNNQIKALEIDLVNYEEIHPKIATNYNKLAQIYI